MLENLAIRVMSPAELDLAIDWAAQEGWNPGINDAVCFRCADPDGFLMAFMDDRPAASLSAVRYGDHFAFLGLYIAVPALRGRGIGRELWRAAMDQLADRVVGLDGVPEQQASYRRKGFELAWRNVRYAGTATVAPPTGRSLVPVDADLMPAILAYDSAFFPASRTEFLRCWLSDSPLRQSWACVEGGAVKAYGTVRQCRTGCKIGPLFADDEQCADLVFRQLARRAGQGPVILDLPEPNDRALRLAMRYGLSPVFETARMYRGPAPALPIARIYGITTFELG